MRVNKRIIIVFLLVGLVVITGCVREPADLNQPSDKPVSNSPQPTANLPQGITVNIIDFKEVTQNDLTPEKVEIINNLRTLRGYYFWKEDNGGYTLFIGMGEKPTGGYKIDVISVEDNEGKTNILVDETVPKADDMVSQALTYPYVVVEMKGITDQFNITNTDKEDYKLLSIDDLKVYTVEGIFQGQIDNNSIEIKIDDSFMVLRNPDITSMITSFQKDDLVLITYRVAENGQNIMECIKKSLMEKDEPQTVIAVYQGQIDNNSIEVKIKETFMVFRNTEMTKLVADYKKDSIVKITYSVADNGQFILMNIEPGK